MKWCQNVNPFIFISFIACSAVELSTPFDMKRSSFRRDHHLNDSARIPSCSDSDVSRKETVRMCDPSGRGSAKKWPHIASRVSSLHLVRADRTRVHRPRCRCPFVRESAVRLLSAVLPYTASASLPLDLAPPERQFCGRKGGHYHLNGAHWENRAGWGWELGGQIQSQALPCRKGHGSWISRSQSGHLRRSIIHSPYRRPNPRSWLIVSPPSMGAHLNSSRRF